MCQFKKAVFYHKSLVSYFIALNLDFKCLCGIQTLEGTFSSLISLGIADILISLL